MISPRRQYLPGSLPLFGVSTLVVWLCILLLASMIHLSDTRVHMVALHYRHRCRSALALIRLPMANALYGTSRRPSRNALSEAQRGPSDPESPTPLPTATAVSAQPHMKFGAFSLSWTSARRTLGSDVLRPKVCGNGGPPLPHMHGKRHLWTVRATTHTSPVRFELNAIIL